MAVVICCPCGTPIDFEQLDVVVSLTCPQCKRELSLEIEDGTAQRRRAVLTVVDGPHWIGERFLVPAALDLQIGQALNNWISFDDEAIAPVHCRLKLQNDGTLLVEDRGSQSGTWVGQQKISKVRLAAKQSFRIGPFRLRFEHDRINGSGSTIVESQTEEDLSGLLPVMQKVGGKNSRLQPLVIRRYQIARGLLMATAVLAGVYNTFGVHRQASTAWRWPPAIALGLGMMLALIAVSRRMTLADRGLRFLSIGLLVIIAIFDLAVGLPMPAATLAWIAIAVVLLVIQSKPAPSLIATGSGVGVIACAVLLIATVVVATG